MSETKPGAKQDAPLMNNQGTPAPATSASPSALVNADPWAALRRHTPARIALGRAGPGLPTREVLGFSLAHARARDAVHQVLDLDRLEAGLRADGYAPLRAHSAAPDRMTYLTRPDLGRQLDAASARLLEEAGARMGAGAGERAFAGGDARALDAAGGGTPGGAAPACDIAIAVADGLSAVAVQRHVLPLLAALRAQAPSRWSGVPLVLALQGRVALGDAIGERLRARLVVMMIGERPGLSSPDSLGLYVTYAPRGGRSDAERNCISNVRPQGLGYAEAARKLDWLAGAALARGLTGIALKDDSEALVGVEALMGAEALPQSTALPGDASTRENVPPLPGNAALPGELA